MIDTLIQDLATALQTALAEPVASDDDFVRLTAAGETLRRALALAGADDAGHPMLAAYDAALGAYAGSVPSSLADDATAVAMELIAYAERAPDEREACEALAMILELEAIMSAVVAAERSGRMPAGTAAELGLRVESKLVGVSDRSVAISQQAEDRWLTTGYDPDLPEAFDWMDTLAEAAPSRVRVRSVAEAAAREHRIAQVMNILARSRPKARVQSLFDVIPPTLLVPRFVPQAHYATTPSAPPKQIVVGENEDLSVFVEETADGGVLVVSLAPPLRVDRIEATVDGAPLPGILAEGGEFRFRLPPDDGRIRIEVWIDDDHISSEFQLDRQP